MTWVNEEALGAGSGPRWPWGAGVVLAMGAVLWGAALATLIREEPRGLGAPASRAAAVVTSGARMRPLSLFALLSAGCLHGSPAASRDVRPNLQQVATDALPSVALVLGSRPDGKQIYGAGLVLGPGSQVLTNLHVLGDQRSIRVLLWAPGRVSYTPMDGGLDRFLFENQAHLIRGTLVRDDPALDLAVIHLDADTSAYPVPRFATAKPRPGEAVLALGHPQEAVWSFTSGVVSTLHHAAIQHDAAINPGSSGGPLLNAQGEVLGINTSKLFSGTDGVAFARPIGLATQLLGAEPERDLDLSSPATAAATCLRAQEIGAHHMTDCIDWERRWEAVVEASRGLDGLAEVLERDGGKAGFIRRYQERLVRAVRGLPRAESADGLRPLPSELYGWVDQRRSIESARLLRLKHDNGLLGGFEKPGAIRELLHKGTRVERVAQVSPDFAWVLLVGRNLDGTEYRFSEAWARRGDTWRQQWPASDEQLRALPVGFARPFDLPAETRSQLELYLAGRIYDLGSARPAAPPAASSGGSDPSSMRDWSHR